MSTVDARLQGPPTIKTLEQKVTELAKTVIGLENTYRNTRKTVIQQLGEIKQLGSDLKIDNIKLREMISESFGLMGVSESWLRKLLPESLKSTKHTRKDYLELQQKRDQQSLQQQQQQNELVQLSTSRHSVSAPQPSDEKTTSTASHDNKAVVIAPQSQNKQEIGLSEELDKHKATIEKLKQRIDELEKENRHLRETAGQHQDQQQQQEERFTARGFLQIKNNDVPVKVTVNVKTKTIEHMVMTLPESQAVKA
jgi:septal ring factor EnvC (AmiA/AmiB activator)